MEDKTVTQQLLQLRTLSKTSCIRKFIELYGYEPKQTKNIPALRSRLAFRIQELHYGGISEKPLPYSWKEQMELFGMS